MKKILFVCHGNICRSPMAELIFKKMVADRGLTSLFSVASRATSTEEIWGGVGNPIYPPAARELERHGIPCEEKRATLLKKSDYDEYDMLIGMDEENMRNMRRIIGGDPSGKLSLLLDCTGEGRGVTDPYYSRRFDLAFRDIYRGCEALLASLLDT